MRGIYKITNKINGKSYIGQSIDIEKRWKMHIYHANTLDSNSYAIHSAIKKYGIENFDFEILEEVQEERDLLEREIFYWELYDSSYNLQKPNETHFNKNSKRVYQINESLEIVNIYESLRDAARQMDCNHSTIGAVCRKDPQANSAFGFYWCYEKDYSLEWRPINKPKEIKNILMLDKEDNIIKEFKDMKEIQKHFKDKSITGIYKCLKGTQKMSLGYKWKTS